MVFAQVVLLGFGGGQGAAAFLNRAWLLLVGGALDYGVLIDFILVAHLLRHIGGHALARVGGGFLA